VPEAEVNLEILNVGYRECWPLISAWQIRFSAQYSYSYPFSTKLEMLSGFIPGNMG